MREAAPPIPDREDDIKGVGMGFDFGTKKIGVAIGQTVTRTASALCTIDLGRKHEPWKTISEAVQTWRPVAFVVGYPYPWGQEENPIRVPIQRFSAGLTRRYGLPAFAADETLSTADARQRHFAGDFGRSAPFRSVKDERAAQLILQMWLEAEIFRSVPGEGL
jgi:putative Holliday junction resolvase